MIRWIFKNNKKEKALEQIALEEKILKLSHENMMLELKLKAHQALQKELGEQIKAERQFKADLKLIK
jgi:hypothetical protein